MTEKSETWRASKTLDCESVSTKRFWVSKRGIEAISKLTSPHMCSIMEFMFRRANYKRDNAISVIKGDIDAWKIPYYIDVSRMSIQSYCNEHFPSYANIRDTLLERNHYDKSRIPRPEQFGIQNDSPYPYDARPGKILYSLDADMLKKQRVHELEDAFNMIRKAFLSRK